MSVSFFMKRALVLINNLEETIFPLLFECLRSYSDHRIKFVSTNSEAAKWLQQQGLNCSLVSLHGAKNDAENRAKACSIVSSETYRDQCVPGTQLESWKVLLWDRFFQFMDVGATDRLQAVIDHLDYQLLIVPLDMHDLVTQRLVGAAKRRGVPVVALVASFLRTKEMLDIPLSYSRYFVSSHSDHTFLVQKKRIDSGDIQIVATRESAGTLAQLYEEKRRTKGDVLANLGIDPSARIVLTTFALRHIWELRQLIKNLSLSLRLSGETAPPHLVIYSEGPFEAKESEILFRKERIHTPFTILDANSDFTTMLCIADHFICFRASRTLDLALQMSTPVTVYDPFYLNRSDQLLFNGDEMRIHSEKNTPVRID
jgi:hypothetical protein